jgi:hypothetical protein
MFQEESAILRQKVSQVKLHRNNQKYLYPNFEVRKGNGKTTRLSGRAV